MYFSSSSQRGFFPLAAIASIPLSARSRWKGFASMMQEIFTCRRKRVCKSLRFFEWASGNLKHS